MLQLFAKEKGVADFGGKTISFKNCSIELDGYSEKESTAAEVYSRLDNLKPGNTNKIAKDILKLVYLGKKEPTKKYKKYLIVSKDHFNVQSKNKKWLADCLELFGIEIFVAPLSEETKKQLAKWQKKQGEKFKK